MKRTSLKKAAAEYTDRVMKTADQCLSGHAWDIEQAFRAGWAASTKNRWPRAAVPRMARAWKSRRKKYGPSGQSLSALRRS